MRRSGNHRLRLAALTVLLSSILVLGCSRIVPPSTASYPTSIADRATPGAAAPAVTPAELAGPLAVSPATALSSDAEETAAPAVAPVSILPTPQISGVPRFEADPGCSSADQLCGYVVVPERHANPGGRTIRLAIQVVARANRDAPPDPVVYLQGGPGVKLGPFSRMSVGSARVNHDVIFYEQRGAGKSQPSLECPERDQQRLDDAVKSVDDTTRTANSRASAAACRDRLLGQGIDLAAYNTVESAADLDDIRAVFGYEQLNLVGISYGTYLAQATMRAYPNSIRSVVLDSVVPLEQPAIPIIPSPNADRAIERTFELCAASPACDRSFPNLPETYKRAIARLRQQPGSIQLGSQYGGATPIGPGRFAQILFRELYSGPAQLPKLIAAVERGDFQPLADRQMQLIFLNRGYSEGMNLSVICHTLGSTQTTELQFTGGGPISGLPWLRLDWPGFCKDWPHAPLDPRFRAAVRSEIPTLIIAGELDPVTPPVSGLRVGQSLPNSIYVEMPAQGHAPGVQTVCGRAIIADFLDRKTNPLNTDCVNGPPVGFSLP